jgi:hypothetical protein
MRTYKLDPATNSKSATKYNYRIVKENNGFAFVVPVKENGEPTTFHTEARLCKWVSKSELIEQ